LWWKCAARWKSLKLRLSLRVLRALKANTKLGYAVGRKWKLVARHKRQDWAIRKIQALLRYAAPRRRFWAQKTIKIWVMLKFSHWILLKRRRQEYRRASYEQETTDILVRRALENLDGLLNDEGSVILSQYVSSVTGVAKQIEMANAQQGSLLSEAKLFPTPKEAPEFARLWTIRAKGMAVLRMRCTAEVTRLARRRFRQSSPALYECRRCAATFLLRQEKLYHLQWGCPLHRRHENDENDDDDEDDYNNRNNEVVDDGEEGRDGFDPNADTNGWRSKHQKQKQGQLRTGGLQTESHGLRKWRQRQQAKAKGFIVPEDNTDELERDYICWKLAAPIVEAALQPLATYLTNKKPHPRGTAFVTKR